MNYHIQSIAMEKIRSCFQTVLIQIDCLPYTDDLLLISHLAKGLQDSSLYNLYIPFCQYSSETSTAKNGNENTNGPNIT